MGLLGTLVVGVIGGMLAMLAVYRTFPSQAAQWIMALVIGLLGGWLGGVLLRVLGLAEANWVGSLVVAFAGATIILTLIRKGTGASTS
jgi:uncharacterized membrane protein YeaQ/YmgE (transglycosylase-associated protein family)